LLFLLHDVDLRAYLFLEIYFLFQGRGLFYNKGTRFGLRNDGLLQDIQPFVDSARDLIQNSLLRRAVSRQLAEDGESLRNVQRTLLQAVHVDLVMIDSVFVSAGLSLLCVGKQLLQGKDDIMSAKYPTGGVKQASSLHVARGSGAGQQCQRQGEP
jgi:hypothetical protein